MKSAEVKRISLAIPLEWEYSHRLVDGIVAYLHERGGYALRDFRFDTCQSERHAYFTSWKAWQPHGILCVVGTEARWLDWILATGLPMVNLTADAPHDVIPCVHGTGSVSLALKHFSSLGFQHVAHIGLQGTLGSRLRLKNLTEGLRAIGREPLCYELEHDPVGCSVARLHQAAMEPGLLQFLTAAPKPLAVLALNDEFARCVSMACQALGLAIPGQVAILGVDDSSIARLNSPPLSSIRPPGERVGYEGMKLLDKLLGGGVPPKQPLLISCDTISIRESTRRNEDASIDHALRLIHAEACRGLTVRDLARFLGVGRSSFERRFTKQVGHAPGEEIQRVRIEQAKTLLLQTELSVTRIANMAGFSRSSSFSAFFRKHEGLAPSEFRQQHVATSHATDD